MGLAPPIRTLAPPVNSGYSSGLRMSYIRSSLALGGLLGLLTACNYPGPTTAATADALAATADALSAASATPSATPSPVPPTPSPSPSATPLPPVLHIVYLEDNDLWALEPGAAPVRLTSSGNVDDVRLASDGELVVYVVRDANFEFVELRAIGFDGTDDRLLVGSDTLGTLYPLEEFLRYTLADFIIAPGTHQVLMNTRGVFEGPGLAKSDDLLALEADSGELLPLLAPGQGGDFTLSPDGSQLAIVRPTSLSFARSDGTDLRSEVLTFSLVQTFSEYFFYPRPIWSPAGDSVLVAIPGENPFAESPAGTIRLVPAAGGSPSVLASISGDLFRPQGETALISPDGTTVAYLRPGAASGAEELVLYRPGTGESFTVATGTLQWRGWAPDSLHFAYTQGSGLDLFLGEVGGPPTSLGSAASLRWIDDRQYLYLAGAPGAWTLTLGDLSAAPIPIVDLAGSDGAFVPYDFAR